MPVALVLAAVLPPLLLGLGLLGGLWLARLLPRWLPAAQGGAAPAGEPASSKPSPAPLHSIHVVACTGTPLAAAASPSPSPRHLSYLGGRPPPSVALPPDYSDSLQSSPSASPISYSRRRGSVDLGPLMRAGASVLSQVMDDLETRSAIIRLMSDNVLPSPQVGCQRRVGWAGMCTKHSSGARTLPLPRTNACAPAACAATDQPVLFCAGRPGHPAQRGIGRDACGGGAHG